MSTTAAARDGVVFVGHATLLIELDGARVLTDPLLRMGIAHVRRRSLSARSSSGPRRRIAETIPPSAECTRASSQAASIGKPTQTTPSSGSTAAGAGTRIAAHSSPPASSAAPTASAQTMAARRRGGIAGGRTFIECPRSGAAKRQVIRMG